MRFLSRPGLHNKPFIGKRILTQNFTKCVSCWSFKDTVCRFTFLYCKFKRVRFSVTHTNHSCHASRPGDRGQQVACRHYGTNMFFFFGHNLFFSTFCQKARASQDQPEQIDKCNPGQSLRLDNNSVLAGRQCHRWPWLWSVVVPGVYVSDLVSVCAFMRAFVCLHPRL